MYFPLGVNLVTIDSRNIPILTFARSGFMETISIVCFDTPRGLPHKGYDSRLVSLFPYPDEKIT